MHSENYKVEIIRGASVGTALGILTGHRFGLVGGLLVGFISAIVMANPIRVWQAIVEITGRVNYLLKTAPGEIISGVKRVMVEQVGENNLTGWLAQKKEEWIKTVKSLGYLGIVLGTICLAITQPFLLQNVSTSANGILEILFEAFLPAVLATILFVALVDLVLDNDGPFRELVETKGKLLWPLCRTLDLGIYQGRLFEWFFEQTISKKLRIEELLDWLEGRAEVLRDWFKAKYNEDGNSEKEVSLGRIVALLGTVFLSVFGLTVGAYLIILFSVFFIGLTILAVILDIPVMIFLKIATSPALAAGEGAALAIFIEGVMFQSFDSGSGGDWLRLVIFSALGAISGLAFYALRQRLEMVGSIPKPA